MSDKLSIKDFANHLPAHSSYDQIQSQIKASCDKLQESIMEEFELLKRVTDSKVVKLRQEFDISLLLKSIEKKADKKETDKEFHDIDSKIS